MKPQPTRFHIKKVENTVYGTTLTRDEIVAALREITDGQMNYRSLSLDGCPSDIIEDLLRQELCAGGQLYDNLTARFGDCDDLHDEWTVEKVNVPARR